MKNKITFKWILIAFLILGSNAMLAQINFEISDHSENSIVISGRSTFHDWTMKTKIFTGNAEFDMRPGDIISLKKLEFSLPVIKLKSDKRALNKNAYRALKSKQFKNIEYKLTSAKIVGEEDYKSKIATVGNLTIAGITKEVNITIYCLANKNGSITCTGKYQIKMTDYNVDPPYFMNGLMSTNEMIDLDISIRFER